MKTGRTLAELAQEIMRQQEAKKDFLAPSKQMTMLVAGPNDGVVFDLNGHGFNAHGGGGFPINETAHDQLASALDIPRKYYDRMREESPQLLAANVNEWLHRSSDVRMVRTLDGRVRGLLSDRYRPLDNSDLAEAVLPVLQERNLHLLSCEITERRLYIKAVDQQLVRDVERAGGRMGEGHTIVDTISPAITISNSEIGYGSLSVEAGVWTRQCTNMATFKQHSTRRYHVGRRRTEVEQAMEFMASQATQRLEDAALWSRLADTVRGAFDEAAFNGRIKLLTDATEQKIDADPVKVVEVTAQRLALTEMERGSVLKHLVAGGDLSRFGLFNAITRSAEDAASYDRATELEALGADVVMLPQSEWKRIANAVTAAN